MRNCSGNKDFSTSNEDFFMWRKGWGGNVGDVPKRQSEEFGLRPTGI
jgi:hypothetical protein